jgi:hypothetical protein
MPTTSTAIQEVVKLAAGDTELFGRTFFPNTLRQSSPAFHRDIDDLLDDRSHRHVAVEIFRGGAKTTKLRIYTAKRISYGLSRTILFVSETQDHSKKSIRWLRKQIFSNKKWTTTYGLKKGGIWTDEAIEIVHSTMGFTITVIAVGITGQLRGVNVDDYRPDLIVVDDPCNEENTGTLEQRVKISNLFFGALEKSLTPATESPDAKMVLLQTVLHEADLISLCHKDPQWASRHYSCFNEVGESRWPARYPTAVLRKDKAAHIARNQLSLWLREMEGAVVAPESADFQVHWLKTFDMLPPLVYVIGVDPVPPPSDKEIAAGLHKKDFECISVVGKDYLGNLYLVEYRTNRGHTPEWTCNTLFELVDKYNPLKVRVEGIAYQRTLEWIVRQEQKKRNRYFQVNAVTDTRRKRHRILQAYSGIASQGKFFIDPGMIEFRAQWTVHPFCTNDDILDATAMALVELFDIDVTDLLRDPLDEEEKSQRGWVDEGNEYEQEWVAAP